MIILDVEQGSPEWINARLGIPTASNFHKIVTPGGKRSSKQRDYLLQLLAEWCSGRTQDKAVGEYMMRGREQEARAAAYWECEREGTLEKVGFILRDDRLAGCSPDRLVVGQPGLAELKVPGLATHLGYLLQDAADDYFPQVQGQLSLAERDWVDLVSYNSTQPSTILRYHRDDDFIKVMTGELDRFLEALVRGREKLTKLGVIPALPPAGMDLTAALVDVLA